MMSQVLIRLQKYVQQKRLPCYFWSEINMLATRTQDELSALQKALSCLQHHFLTAAAAVVAVFTKYNDSGVSSRRLPAREPSKLWQFVLDRDLQTPFSLEKTWLTYKNFCGLLGMRKSAMNQTYQRVLEELTSGRVKRTNNGPGRFADDWMDED